MATSDELKATVILEIPNTKLFHIDSKKSTLLNTGTLSLLYIPEESLYILSLESFAYSLSKQIPIMKDSLNHIVIPDVEGFYGLVFPTDVSSDSLKLLEAALSDQCDFNLSSEPKIQIIQEEGKVLKELTKYPSLSDIANLPEGDSFKIIERMQQEVTQPIEERPGPAPYERVKRLNTWLAQSSSAFKNTVEKGVLTGVGVMRYGSNFIKSKLSPSERPLHIPIFQMFILRIIRTASQKILSLSKSIVRNSVAASTRILTSISNRFGGNGDGNIVTKTKAFQSAKEVGKTTLVVAVNVYEALEEALLNLAKATSEVTVDVVRYKFGEDAAEATKTGMDVMVNIVKIGKEIKKVGLKTIVKSSAKETAKNILQAPEKEITSPSA
jgi:spartin